jgi:lipopolysaccharide transport system permease protein
LSLVRELNPMTGLVGEFRTACLGGTVDWGSLARSAAFAIVLFLVGCSYFRKVEGHFGDII